MALRHNPDQVFAQLGMIVLGEQPLPQILERVVHLACEMLPGTAEASITLLTDDEPATLAFTGEVAIALDERQYLEESGPCLTCARSGQTITVPDITCENRWPGYAEQARGYGVLSSLSVPLVQRTIAGALNYYLRDPGEFDPATIDTAETFAGHAAVAVANAHLYEATAALAEQMRQAMASRAVIEQAKGIIMRDRGCSSDEAFGALVHLSQTTHVKLRDLAQLLVEQVAEGSMSPESSEG
jgi:GAF domain-containing protein